MYKILLPTVTVDIGIGLLLGLLVVKLCYFLSFFLYFSGLSGYKYILEWNSYIYIYIYVLHNREVYYTINN